MHLQFAQVIDLDSYGEVRGPVEGLAGLIVPYGTIGLAGFSPLGEKESAQMGRLDAPPPCSAEHGSGCHARSGPWKGIEKAYRKHIKSIEKAYRKHIKSIEKQSKSVEKTYKKHAKSMGKMNIKWCLADLRLLKWLDYKNVSMFKVV